MLSEFFAAHPLKDFMLPGPFSLFPPAEDRGAWESLSPEYKREILALAEEYAARPYPLRKATDLWPLPATRTGSRPCCAAARIGKSSCGV